MTSLDPSHIPGFERTDDPRTGQAVKTSVSTLAPATSARTASPPSRDDGSEPVPSEPHAPSWKGAWKRRQEANAQRQRELLGERRRRHDDATSDSDDSDDEDGDAGSRQKVPIPPIPDLRYEQGILASIRPFLHSTTTSTTDSSTAGGRSTDGSASPPHETAKHERNVETAEKAALASTQLTAEESTGSTNQSDALMRGLRIEWGNVVYVLVRDQVVFPLLQGILWGMAGIYLNGLWDWNKRRLAVKSAHTSTADRVGGAFATRLGLPTR